MERLLEVLVLIFTLLMLALTIGPAFFPRMGLDFLVPDILVPGW